MEFSECREESAAWEKDYESMMWDSYGEEYGEEE